MTICQSRLNTSVSRVRSERLEEGQPVLETAFPIGARHYIIRPVVSWPTAKWPEATHLRVNEIPQ